MTQSQSIAARLKDGVLTGVFPNAELLVCKKGQILLHEYAGSFNDETRALFDLASITKPLCTAMLFMQAHQNGDICLDDKVQTIFRVDTLQNITIRQLLNHTSGLIDWAPFYAEMIQQESIDFLANKKKIINLIINDDNMDRLPKATHYSDIGYILLGAVLEIVYKDSLDELFKRFVTDPLGLKNRLFFIPLFQDSRNSYHKEDFVSTVNCTLRKKVVRGEVMDRNCYVMGGVSGHAGLFSDATSIHKMLLELKTAARGKSSFIDKETFDLFLRPDLTREWNQFYYTLGFDTNTKGISQSGSFFSKNTIGHLGYSGTSFWWDIERDFWIILLTNRCMPERKNFKIQQYRPSLHDFIVKELNL